MSIPAPTVLPPGYSLETCRDLARALDRIWKAGLMQNDEETSRVMALADPYCNPDRTGITRAWMVIEDATGKDVGMCLLSPPSPDTCGRAELNVFVSDRHRGCGLGECLLLLALAEDPHAVGFYSLDSVKLYAKHQVGCAWPAPVSLPDRAAILPADLALHLGGDNLTQNQREHVQWMVQERESYDHADQARRPRLHA